MELFTALLGLWLLVNSVLTQLIQEPKIGAYKINFRGDIVQVVSELRNSKVNFPLLRPTYYATTSYELLCNSTNPVQWIYVGFGAPNARIVTVRKEDETFQSKVIFMYTEAMQSGKYVCENTVNNLSPSAYFELNVGNDTKILDQFSMKTIYQTQQNQNEIIQTSSEDLKLNLKGSSSEIICCNTLERSFPKLRQQQCSSVSDCGLRISYMENHPEPDLRLPLANYHKETIDGNSCAIFDLHENYMHDHGLIQCSIDARNGNKYIMYSQTNDHLNLLTNFNSVPQKETIMKIYVEPTREENVFISCITNGFFFAQGIRIGIQSSITKNKIEFLNRDGKVSALVPKRNVTGKTVYCFAPVWNSLEWRNVSMIVEL